MIDSFLECHQCGNIFDPNWFPEEEMYICADCWRDNTTGGTTDDSAHNNPQRGQAAEINRERK